MITSVNPATEETLAEFEPWSTDQVDEAVERVAEAQRMWRDMTVEERAVPMRRVAELLRERAGRYGALITSEMGKPIVEAEAEVNKCALACDHYADHAAEYLADAPVATESLESYVAYEPLGIVLAIMPWNFPFWQVFRAGAPTLMAGNGIVLKHASNVPQSALACEEVLRDAGIPQDLLRTVLVAGADTERLIDDDRIAAVTLTGSSEVGARIASLAAARLKKPTKTAMPSPSVAAVPPDEVSSMPAIASPAVEQTPEPPEPSMSELTGTWEMLAPMPGAGFRTADSLVLPDGRMVVFRWGEGSAGVVVYDPRTNVWQPASFEGERPGIGTDQAFALASDGRIYTHDYVIDASGQDWSVVPFQLVRETDVWAGMPLAAGPDGHVYHPADDVRSRGTQLIGYDPESDTFVRSSFAPGSYPSIMAGPDALYAFGGDGAGARLIAYDPDSDTWSAASHVAEIDPLLAGYHGAVGPDALIYVPAGPAHSPLLWAISPDDGRSRLVEVPEDVDEWAVELQWGRDDRLYAFGRDRAWAFTPED